ncbi:hypothetical protein ABT124_50760, partial [Streptomyces sp. NPDC001982]|uniref:hypothetical protein n=1 Tax=Streptomyces sp. NPDC001982 TaxID=3154405 RepID=UPI003322A1FC
LTLDEDQDDQKIAKWVTVHPPISGQFSPVADIQAVTCGSRATEARAANVPDPAGSHGESGSLTGAQADCHQG